MRYAMNLWIKFVSILLVVVTASAVLLDRVPYATGQGRAKRTQWEYGELGWREHGFNEWRWIGLAGVGEAKNAKELAKIMKLELKRDPDVREAPIAFMNALGSEGWELVSIRKEGNVNFPTNVATFKRPK